MIIKQISHLIISHIGSKYFILAGLILLTLSACNNQVQNEPLLENPSPTDIPAFIEDTPSIDNQVTLDLREANVVSVSFEVLDNGSYRFDVTLQHDDEGEAPKYADHWQVEDLEGNVLGRRVLTHSHSNQPFTRSETISIPDGITQVIVRGHDMNHAYGGQAMNVDLLSGETRGFIENDAVE